MDELSERRNRPHIAPLTAEEIASASWRRSTSTQPTGNVEVAWVRDGTIVAMRNCDRTDAISLYTLDDWANFVEKAKRGEYDL